MLVLPSSGQGAEALTTSELLLTTFAKAVPTRFAAEALAMIAKVRSVA